MLYGCLYIFVCSLLFRQSKHAKGNSIGVTNTSGIITSPNYPNEYNNNLDCEYIIQSPTKQPITLVFEDFDIEDDDECTKDYVSVRDGISKSSKQLGKFCGRRIPRIPVILSGTVFVIFRSNNVAPWSGFKAEYKEYKEVPFLDCSGFLNVSMGRIQSPKHPEKYDSNTDCVYTLASQYNGQINLTFTFFEMEDPLLGNCTYDFVEIYDSNTSIGKFCGFQKPVLNLTFTLSSSVRVVFHSDSSRNYKGFSANFAEITVDQATDEVLTTVSFFPTSGNMRNNNITPFTNTSSVNSVVIGAGTGGIIAVIAVITIICVIIGRQRRTQTNRIKRKHPTEPMEKSYHVYNNVVNIDHCSTTNSVEYSIENANTDLEKEIHTGDAEMNKEGIADDEIDNEYLYSNLLTDDTSSSNHNAESSYYDLSDSYNREHEIQTVIKTSPNFKTNGSEYMDQGEVYNILNIRPQKIKDTENFDRTIDDVYDKTTHITSTSYSDLGLYDHSSNN